MPNYDVPGAMAEFFYGPLRAADWQATGTHQGDEWTSPDGLFEIEFRHSLSIVSMRYRRAVRRVPGEATETYLDRRARTGWNTLTRDYGHTRSHLGDWAGTALATLNTWCESMQSVALAPGEDAVSASTD